MNITFEVPDGWSILQNGEIVQQGDRYFAEKAIRMEKDYLKGSKILSRWNYSLNVGKPLSDKIRPVYIRELTK